MTPLRLRLARALLARPRAGLLLFALLTVLAGWGLPGVKLETVFSDLLPADDPFVQVFQDHPNFGNPLTMILMVQKREGQGTIYDPATLAKVWQLTRDIDLAPGVNHDSILSITTEKARYSEATPYGIDMRPLMGSRPPQTAEEIAAFRARVDQAPNVRVFLISPDQRSTLIMATFIEHRVDWGEAFEYAQALVEGARDEAHEVYLTGQPALIGWVYRYEWQMIGIFAITLGALVLALLLYLRSVLGLVAPIVSSAVAAIWALGLMGWMGVSIEPLLMVVPLLLIARSFSHCVQYMERYGELYAQLGDRQRAAEATLTVMMAPSLLGILTDILGIAVVAAAPIPAMWRHALFCGLWALWLIPTGIVLVALLLRVLPPPRPRTAGAGDPLRRLLRLLASAVQGRPAIYTTAVMLVLALAASLTARQIRIGNPVEGSHLLWEDSELNTAVRAVNDHFPGVNTLEIVLEAKDPARPEWTVAMPETVAVMQALQRRMEAGPAPPRASLSFADYMAEANRLFNGGHPKWLPLDPRERALNSAAVGAMMGSSATAFTHVISPAVQHATVSFWYPDNRQETVDAALAAARAAVAAVGEEHAAFRVRLGTGIIALQEAVNRVVARYHWVVVGALNLFIFVMAAVAYRSLVAGLLLLVPVNLSNEALIATMHLLGVGLDVNSMIVAAIGLGVGIDYGIYLLSRIAEEFHAQDRDWGRAITAALATTGRAILFTASIMALGILPWYLLSDLKFVADMGLLLVAIMGINMLFSLVVLPLLVWWVRPAFITRADHRLAERLDPRGLQAAGR
ncbi:MAG TPA: MMPL family transporter [Nevskiaceae bacterium]|nr:MMPL family transporter [Nevskiaceae bacterium]